MVMAPKTPAVLAISRNRWALRLLSLILGEAITISAKIIEPVQINQARARYVISAAIS